MSFQKWAVAGAFVAALGTAASAQLSSPQLSSPQLLRPYPYHVDMPYEVVPDFFKPKFPEGWTWGTVEGAYVESPDRIYVYQQGILPKLQKFVGADGYPATREGGRQTKLVKHEFVLTIFDGKGNHVGNWPALNAVHHSHGVKVNPYDPEKHVWLVNFARPDEVDVAVLKYTRDGKEVMRITTDKLTGCPTAQDLWFMPNGDFWCLSDPPHGGIIKFSKDGKKLFEFGNKEGTGPGEFRGAHSIAIDKKGRIFVGDRNNFRIQIFDQTGKYLESWPDVSARSMGIDAKDRLWVICGSELCGKDKPPHSMATYDMNGKLLFTWGVPGGQPGQMYYNGQFDIDSDGNLYIGEVGGGRVQKWRPRAGANKDHMIAYPMVR